MYDVLATYDRPADVDAFLAHYRSTHVPLCLALPEIVEFNWGLITDPSEDGPFAVARMTFADAAAVERSFGSAAGQAAVADVANFAPTGSRILHLPGEAV